MLRDNNRIPYQSLDSFEVAESIPTAFVGATGNARGDKDGSLASFSLFTVTGEVLVAVYGVCTTDLAGASGTVALGVTGNTGMIIAATTATEIDDGDVWTDTTPSVGGVPIDELTFFVVTEGLDILETSATTDISSGNIKYTCIWRPLVSGSSVVSLYPRTATLT